MHFLMELVLNFVYFQTIIRFCFDLQDLEVNYFHAFIDGVDFVFIDAPLFRHRQDDIYGGSRQVMLLSFS
jgi:hypothetical protein